VVRAVADADEVQQLQRPLGPFAPAHTGDVQRQLHSSSRMLARIPDLLAGGEANGDDSRPHRVPVQLGLDCARR
jgi:hypothetical protein